MNQSERSFRQTDAAARLPRQVSTSVGVLSACLTGAYLLFSVPDRRIVVSAWVVFGAALSLTAARAVRAGSLQRHTVVLQSPYLAVAFVGLALILYIRSIGIGLLSDDYELLDWATRGEWLPASWHFVRPLHLLIWGVVARLVPAALVPAALHVLSITLHGINGFLLARLARILGCSSAVAVLSGVLFVAYPSSVEAVVWPSAFADVLLATLVLASISVFAVVKGSWGLVLCVAPAALATKETAVAFGPLLMVLAVVAPADQRRTFFLSGMSASLITAVYAIWRIAASNRLPPHSGFGAAAVTAVIVEPFATLGLPLHASAVHAAPLGAVIWVLALSAILVGSPFRWRSDPAAPQLVLLAIPWIVLTVVPTIWLFGIGADLQGSRYVYLPTCLWALTVTTLWLLRPPGQLETYCRRAAYALALILATVVTHLHQRPWREAAAMRDITLSSIAALPDECHRVFVVAPPDNVEGAYVARNGLTQALAREHGRVVAFVPRPEDATPDCRVDLADLSQ